MTQVDREALQRLVDKDDRSARAISKDAGLGETAIKDIIRAKSVEPGAGTIAQIAEALGVPTSDLMKKGSPLAPLKQPPRQRAGITRTTIGADLKAQEKRRVASDRRTTAELRKELVEVGEQNVRLSAGPGAIIDAEHKIGVWHFPRRYVVDEMRLSPGQLAVVEVEGDSMFPTLSSGDRVMIDHHDKNPAKPGIYAIWDSGATVVKRLERIPASDPPMVVLISDNKNHNAYTVLEEYVKIIGRVVWYARRL